MFRLPSGQYIPYYIPYRLKIYHIISPIPYYIPYQPIIHPVDWNNTPPNIYIYIYILDSHMRLTAHVKSSKVKFEAVQRHRRKDKEGRTELSRVHFWAPGRSNVLPELCFWVQVAPKCCPICAFECRWLRSAEYTSFCRFSPSSIAESPPSSPGPYANLIFNIYIYIYTYIYIYIYNTKYMNIKK